MPHCVDQGLLECGPPRHVRGSSFTSHGYHTASPQGERRAGFVGLPLPGVRVKVAADADAPCGADPDPSGATASAM